MATLALRNVSFSYPTADTPTLRRISFSVEEGAFLTICGETGCGKTTLLRLMKPQLTPKGTRSGEILLGDTPIEEIPAQTVGFVSQHPEEQIVTDRVWHELAFGLENLGTPPDEIRIRVAEMASYFGMTNQYDRDTASLSGGQKQLLHLASVMVMQPQILILDEPTAQLDPIAAADFMATLKRLHRDFSLTILLVEHRLEEAIPASTAMLLLEKGRIAAFGSPRAVLSALPAHHSMTDAMPVAARLYHKLPKMQDQTPLSVAEGKAYLQQYFTLRDGQHPLQKSFGDVALSLKGICFRYERRAEDILHECDLTLHRGQWICLLGDNGAGKSTLLKNAAGLLRPYCGKITVLQKPIGKYEGGDLYQNCIAMLPQNVQMLFARNTVAEELAETQCMVAALPFDLPPILQRHPYDLSGGQQQLVALGKILGQHPQILLLDEPTKGLDVAAKAKLGAILRGLCDRGVAILTVTHDVEFAALFADTCGLLFRGAVIGMQSPTAFFSQNYFYTTAARRISRGLCENAITAESVAECCTVKAKGGAAQ